MRIKAGASARKNLREQVGYLALRRAGLRPARRSGFCSLCAFSFSSNSDLGTLISFRMADLNSSNGCRSRWDCGSPMLL